MFVFLLLVILVFVGAYLIMTKKSAPRSPTASDAAKSSQGQIREESPNSAAPRRKAAPKEE
jgi:uncharacterized membrane protein